jgi:hypothetical protein
VIMASKRVYIARVLNQNFQPNKTVRNPDKLIVRRLVQPNCWLSKGKYRLSTGVDKTVRNSRGI